MGRLQIKVCGARNLDHGLLGGTPDPYVKLNSDSTHFKTFVVKDTSNPEWNETFDIHISGDDNAVNYVDIEVWSDKMIHDSKIGMYVVSTENLTRGIVTDGWFPLSDSHAHAEVHLRLLAVDFGMPAGLADEWRVTTDINHDPQHKTPTPSSGAHPPHPHDPQHHDDVHVHRPDESGNNNGEHHHHHQNALPEGHVGLQENLTTLHRY